MVIIIGEVGKTCPKCGKFFLGNKCPYCEWEVLPATPKSIKKKKIKGVFH